MPVTLNHCDECGSITIESCTTGNYFFYPLMFNEDAYYRIVITNPIGVKFVFDQSTDGSSMVWDMSIFPEGWLAPESTYHVQLLDGNDGITPLTYTDGVNTWSCFWLNFNKVLHP